MMTTTFHRNSNLLGINIEKNNDNSFIVCIAYSEESNWKAKTISGVSGNLNDDKLVQRIISSGHSIDKETAICMFSRISEIYNDYIE
jgi:hypothetical protein